MFVFANIIERITGELGYFLVRHGNIRGNGRVWMSYSVWRFIHFGPYKLLMIYLRDPLKHWRRKHVL